MHLLARERRFYGMLRSPGPGTAVREGKGKRPLYVHSSRINVHGAMDDTKFKSSRLPSAGVMTVPQRTEICGYDGRSCHLAPLRPPRHRITPPTPTTR